MDLLIREHRAFKIRDKYFFDPYEVLLARVTNDETAGPVNRPAV